MAKKVLDQQDQSNIYYDLHSNQLLSQQSFDKYDMK